MSGTPDLSPSDVELLLALATEQERYERREGWNFQHTLWSRVTYVMASAHDKLTATHIPGKFDMDRAFERGFRKIVDGLVKRGLIRFRPIGDHRQPRQTLGYKGHEARVRDIFLTAAGKATVAALRRAAAPTASDGEVAAPRPPLPEPDGDVGGSPLAALPEPDGDPGWPEERAAAPGRPPVVGPGPLNVVDDPVTRSRDLEEAEPGRRPRAISRPRARRTPRRAPEARPRVGRRGR